MSACDWSAKDNVAIEVVIMNILDTVGIRLPCHSCGGTYQVPLKDVLLSHTMLHEGCPAREETECPPVFQSRLFERKDIEELERAWNQLDQRAQADGGRLVLMTANAPDETEPAGAENAAADLPGPSQAPVPTASTPPPARKRLGKQTEKTKKVTVRRQTQLKSRTRRNRKVA